MFQRFYLRISAYTAIMCAIIVIFCSSCNKNSTSGEKALTNDSIIPHDKMVNVLKDIHLAEAAISIKQLQNQSTVQYSKQYYSFILQKYNISVADFRNSLNYYFNNVEEFEVIYSEVIAKLTQYQGITNASGKRITSFHKIADFAAQKPQEKQTGDTL